MKHLLLLRSVNNQQTTTIAKDLQEVTLLKLPEAKARILIFIDENGLVPICHYDDGTFEEAS